MKRLIVALAAFSFVFLTSGCGQSGPLYIPGNPSKIQVPPPAEDTAEGEEEKEDNGDTDKK